MNAQLISFSKYSATGNDFIIIDDRLLQFPISNNQYIKKLCTRRSGIGADGLILLHKSDKSDFKMRYFNADGIESEMCGNGSRSIVAFARELGIIEKSTNFDSMLSCHEGKIVGSNISVKMNVPQNLLLNEPMILNLDFEVGGSVEIGVPHYILYSPEITSLDVQRLGEKIAHNDHFSKGTNVNFVQLKSNSEIDLRTYERGVEAETLACGTGATASVLITAKIHHLKSPVKVNVLGGSLNINFDEGMTEFWLTGTVNEIYRGEIQLNP